MNKDEIIGTISSVLGAACSATLNVISKDGASSIVATSSAPLLSLGFEKVIMGIVYEGTSDNELERLGISANTAKETYDKNINQGKTIVNSLFTDSDKTTNKGYTYNEVLENILKSVKDDTFSLKAEIYGRFVGNIPFRGDLDASNIVFLKNMISDLSFTELCILEVLSRCSFTKLNNIQIMIGNNNKPILFEFYNGIIELKSKSLLLSTPPFSVGDNIGNLKVSKIGEFLCDVAELHEINKEWLDITEDILNGINEYKEGTPFIAPSFA